MKIDSLIVKEKSISRNDLQPVKNLRLKLNRINLMPPPAEELDKFSCVIEVDLTIENEAGSIIASARLGYFIFATLEDGDTYEQNGTADEIFRQTYMLYWKDFNYLLEEVKLPPMPLESIQVSLKKNK